MGAAKYREQRAADRAAGPSKQELEAQEKAKNQKRNKVLISIGCVVGAILIAGIVLVNSSLFYGKLAAVKVGTDSYSVGDVSYTYQNAYQNFYSNYSSYISYLIDTSKDLDEQTCTLDSSMTWKDYFLKESVESLQQETALYRSAVNAGYTLTEDEQASINDNISMLQLYASLYGYSTETYIVSVYGNGNTVDSVRRMMEIGTIASDYAADISNGFTYSDTELDAYFDGVADSYNTVSYLYIDADAESAGRIANAAEDKASFNAACLELTEKEATSSSASMAYLPSGAEEFFSNTANIGSTFSVPGDETTRVYFFVSYNDCDYDLASMRHILIMAEDTDADGIISEAELAACREKVETIQAEWDGTEDGFITLAEERSEDTGSNTSGGLYENINKGAMVTEIDNWLFENGRRVGDTAILFGSSSSYTGYHLVYFAGYGELYSRYIADNLMRSNDYSEWMNNLLEGYPVSTTWMFRYA